MAFEEEEPLGGDKVWTRYGQGAPVTYCLSTNQEIHRYGYFRWKLEGESHTFAVHLLQAQAALLPGCLLVALS